MSIQEIISRYGMPLLGLFCLILLLSPFREHFLSLFRKKTTKPTVSRPKAVSFLEKLQAEKFITFNVCYRKLADEPFFIVRRSLTNVEVLKKNVNGTFNYFQIDLQEFITLAQSRGSVSTYLMLNQLLNILTDRDCVKIYIDTQPEVQSILREVNLHIF